MASSDRQNLFETGEDTPLKAIVYTKFGPPDVHELKEVEQND